MSMCGVSITITTSMISQFNGFYNSNTALEQALARSGGKNVGFGQNKGMQDVWNNKTVANKF